MTAPSSLDALDLVQIANNLKRKFANSPVGTIVGRLELRDEVVRSLGCSQLDGARIVDQLVARGLLLTEDDPSDVIHWAFHQK